MKHIDNIRDELGSLGVEYLNKVLPLPYEVPANYFDLFALQLQTAISDVDLLDEPQITKAMADNQNFSVPEGYFDQFAQNILQQAKDAESLEDASIPSTELPYLLPSTAYFENFAASITSVVQEADPPLSFGKVAVPFESPSVAYFEQQISNILIHVGADELQEAPLLRSINKVNPFTVPAQYLEQFTVATPSVNVVPFEPAGKRKWTTWAAAAAVALMLSFGMNYLFNGNTAEPSSANTDLQSLMVNISSESIDEYIDVNLEEFANTAIAANFLTDDANLISTSPEVQNLIKEISAEELNEYLNIVE